MAAVIQHQHGALTGPHCMQEGRVRGVEGRGRRQGVLDEDDVPPLPAVGGVGPGLVMACVVVGCVCVVGAIVEGWVH